MIKFFKTFSSYFLFILVVNNLGAFENKIKDNEIIKFKIISVTSIQNDSSLIALKYSEIFNLFEEENYPLALENALDFLQYCQQLDNKYWIYKITFLIANMYDKTNRYRQSLKYYKRSLDQLKLYRLDNKDIKFKSTELAESILKIGSSYHKISLSIDLKGKLKFNDSIKWLNEKSFYLDSAKSYYKRLENLHQFNSEIENLKAKAYSNLSSIYEQGSSYDKAEDYINLAINIHKKNNNYLSRAKSLNNLGNIFLRKGEYKKSKEKYIEALTLIKFNNNFDAIRTKASLNYNLAWAMRNLEDFKAYDFQEKYILFQDAIREKEFNGIIEEINKQYDFDSKKELLLKEEENKRLKDQRTFWVIGIIALIIILSLVYTINLYKLKQKNLALSFSQNQLLKNQEIEKLKSESQVRILNATIDGKETERKQIAETLHDSVSALLSSANLHLQATRKQFNGRTPIEIDKTQKIIEEASYKVRDLSHNLVSSVLLKFGLTFAINDIADKYSNSELTIDTEITNIGRYLQSFEIKVYNIIQEFINNILKHSEADNALIELKEENNIIFLTISDDGIGFDKTKINTKAGLGINQIDARIQMMRGKFNIKSSENNGTKISVELPIVEKEEPNHV